MDMPCSMEFHGGRISAGRVAQQVNRSKTTFSKRLSGTGRKVFETYRIWTKDPFAYGYNDACTAFAKGESAMYPIGSYAVPQILSVNPQLNIDSFVMPANDQTEQNALNSGIDLQFCIAETCENKEAAYEVLDFLYSDENIQAYADLQNAIPCKEGDFELSPMLNGMTEYIEAGKMYDFQELLPVRNGSRCTNSDVFDSKRC